MSKNFKRIAIATLTGAVLGIFCIIGISYRLGIEGNELFLLAVWYNRLLIGIVIGVASSFKIIESELNVYFRGFCVRSPN